jgi:hypothetical protein
LFPISCPCFVTEKIKKKKKKKKKKEKKIRTALPGHFGLSVRSLLTIWKRNGAEACGLLDRSCLSLAFRTIV